jgi:TfoX/Sxy family transcriptional regulator of competence genes
MTKNDTLTDRVREALADVSKVEEKKMFGSIAFMVNGKMCINVGHDRIMCRIAPELHQAAISKPGCRTVTMKNREYTGYVFVSEKLLITKKDLEYWIKLSLDFNEKAKATRKTKKK